MSSWQGLDPRTIGLMLALADTINRYTGKIDPNMPSSMIVEALCFTAGSAIGQPEMERKTRLTTRAMRELAHDRIDKGIQSAKGTLGKVSPLILPN